MQPDLHVASRSNARWRLSASPASSPEPYRLAPPRAGASYDATGEGPALDNAYGYGGKTFRSTRFGEDYLDEYRRVIETHATWRTGAVLEWGAGHTTLLAAELHEALGVGSLDTIDHDEAYLEAIAAQAPAWDGFKTHACDLTGPRRSNHDPELAYSTLPLGWGRRFDFILIDGRRRLECALVAAMVSHKATVVALHDYRRARYQPMLKLYDVIEDGAQFRVMRLKHRLFGALARDAGGETS